MSQYTVPDVEIAVEVQEDDSIAGAIKRRIEALKAGDVGSLPVIFGMILITIFFTAKRVLHRGQLRQPDPADVAGHGDGDRRRLRAPDR